METRNEESKCPEPKDEQPKSRLERWIEKLEERIAPCNPHFNAQGKYVSDHCHYRYRY